MVSCLSKGCVLDPLLFLLYISHLANIPDNTPVGYSDDSIFLSLSQKGLLLGPSKLWRPGNILPPRGNFCRLFAVLPETAIRGIFACLARQPLRLVCRRLNTNFQQRNLPQKYLRGHYGRQNGDNERITDDHSIAWRRLQATR